MRLNGKVFEGVVSLLERRRPLDLYRTALEVHVPEGRYTIESTPVPNGDAQAWGAVDYNTGDTYRGVAEAAADDLGVHAGAKQLRGVRVARIVEEDGGRIGPGDSGRTLVRRSASTSSHRRPQTDLRRVLGDLGLTGRVRIEGGEGAHRSERCMVIAARRDVGAFHERPANGLRLVATQVFPISIKRGALRAAVVLMPE